MNWKPRILGALLLVMVGMSVSAAPASAEFFSAVEHTTFDGTQVGSDLFAFNAGGVTCAKITYTGTQTGKTATSLSLTPSYAECNAFGFPGTTIDVNGCQMIMRSAIPNTVDLSCPSKPIEVTGPNCTLTIPSQSAASTSNVFKTEGVSPNRDVKLELTLVNLRYTQVGKGATPCTSGTFTNGSYTGAATVTGTDTVGSKVDFYVKEPEDTPGKFHSSVAHTLFSGNQIGEDNPSFNIGTFRCTSITYSGTQIISTPSKLYLSPVYSGCSSGVYGAITVHTNGCLWVFKEASVELACPSAPMEITFSSVCTVTLNTQTLNSVSYSNEGTAPKRDIRVSITLSGIKYTQDSGTFPGCSSGTFTNGVYTGAATVKGTDTSGAQTDLRYE